MLRTRWPSAVELVHGKCVEKRRSVLLARCFWIKGGECAGPHWKNPERFNTLAEWSGGTVAGPLRPSERTPISNFSESLV
ncbi:MAG: hypothetical protein ACQESR_08675 [Planctomycetota bacterium]